MTTFQAHCEFCDKAFISPIGIKQHLKFKICRGGNHPNHTNRAQKNKERSAEKEHLHCPCGAAFKTQNRYDNHREICKGTEQLVPLTQKDYRNALQKKNKAIRKKEGRDKPRKKPPQTQKQKEHTKEYLAAYYLKNKEKILQKRKDTYAAKQTPQCDERVEVSFTTPTEAFCFS